MTTITEMEKIVADYEKKIHKLKWLDNVLNDLDVKGFEQEVSEIKKQLKDPKSVEKIEIEIKELSKQIQDKKNINQIAIENKKLHTEDQFKEQIPKQQRDYQRFSQHFPYELNPYYSEPGLIGKGGFARVFRANRKKDNGEVAVKIPISLDRAIGKSFIKEMENWTKLMHPNIVEIFDYNVLPVPYFEMELCDSCLDILSKPMDVDRATWIIFNVAEGLKYAHNKGIIHRDIKPQNILLKDGVPKISDWGLSKITAESRTSTMAAFSPVYAAPEHFSKKFGNKDEQTDIWQLGVVFYELVCDKLPFEGDDFVEISSKIAMEDCCLPSESNVEASRVNNIIITCLQKEKSKRYKKIEDLQKDLASILKIEYKDSLKKSQDINNLTKSAYFCGELLLVNMKIGEIIEAYKYASDMLKYAQDTVKVELDSLCKDLEAIIENSLDINEQVIQKADVIVHKLRLNL
jgi:eukaryotic-like serine/threonine-protein kinase